VFHKLETDSENMTWTRRWQCPHWWSSRN